MIRRGKLCRKCLNLVDATPATLIGTAFTLMGETAVEEVSQISLFHPFPGFKLLLFERASQCKWVVSSKDHSMIFYSTSQTACSKELRPIILEIGEIYTIFCWSILSRGLCYKIQIRLQTKNEISGRKARSEDYQDFSFVCWTVLIFKHSVHESRIHPVVPSLYKNSRLSSLVRVLLK